MYSWRKIGRSGPDEKTMSIRNFFKEIEVRLASSSPENLREIINWFARDVHPFDREEFLSYLVSNTSLSQNDDPDELLLGEIQDLYEKAESGDLCIGFGWDRERREERDFGDESWAEEVDDFFFRARDALACGHLELARSAFEAIFSILDLAEEVGHLPGPEDPTELLKTDLHEMEALYLRATYLITPENVRCSMINEVIERFCYFSTPSCSIKDMLDAGVEELPNFNKFLVAWIDFLEKTNVRCKKFLLGEALQLEGIKSHG